MKFRWDKKYLYWGITAFLVIISSICFYYLIFHSTNLKSNFLKIMSILMPIIDGLILAYLMSPIVNWLEGKFIYPFLEKKKIAVSKKVTKFVRAGSIIVTLIIVAICIYAFLVMVIPQLIQSVQSIVYQFPSYVNNLSAWLAKVLAANPEIEHYVVTVIDTYSIDIGSWMNKTLLPQINALVKVVSVSVLGMLEFTWNMILGLVISIYLLASKEKFLGQCKKIFYAFLEPRRANEWIEDLRLIHRTFGGFINGKILDSIIIGILCFVIINVMGTPYPMLISVIVGVTNVIPFFGPYLGAIPSALLILMVDPLQCLYFIIFILILQQFDGNFLGPKILGDSTGLSSFWVIFSITVFGGLIGVAGMVIGVPLFAVIYAFVKRRVNRNLRKKGMTVDTDAYIVLDQVTEEGTFLRKESAVKGRGKAKEQEDGKEKRKENERK